MGFTWNSAIAAGAQHWTDLTWLNHLVNAANQRGSVSVGSGLTAVSLGDDVQQAGFWSGIQSAVSTALAGLGTGLTPPNIGNGGGVWLDVSGPVDATNGFVGWTESTLRTALSLINGVLRAGGTPSAYWRRQRPRTVTLPTDATDTDGNTLSNGMIAWLTGAPAPTTLAKLVGPITNPSAAPTLAAATGGGLAAGTYYVKFTWHNGIGETLPSPEATITLAAPGSIVVTVPSLPTNAVLAAIYLGTSSGAETLNDTTPTTICTTARLTPAGAVPPTSNLTQWIPAASTDVPDVLDSNNSVASNAHVDPGVMQAGDYISHEMLIELRAILNAMAWVRDPYPTISSGFGTVLGGSGPLKAVALASYPGGPFGSFWPQGGDVLGYGVATDNEAVGGAFGAPPNPQYAVETGSNTVSSTTLGTLDATVDFWVRPEIDNAGTAGGPVAYDAQGSGLTQNQWQKWTSVGPASGAVASGAWPVVEPSNWPTPAPGQVAQNGYIVTQSTTVFTDVIAVQRYDVAGGFDETASSP